MNKGRIRTRRLTIRAKILIPSIIIVVLVCGLMGYNSYTRFEESMVRMGVEEADMAATIVADSLDANLVYKVTVGSEGTQVYQNLQGDLRKKQKACGIAFLYTLYTDGKKVYYGVDSDIFSNSARFSSTLRSRYGLFLPGCVRVPRYSRICSGVSSSTYARPLLISSIA